MSAATARLKSERGRVRRERMRPPRCGWERWIMTVRDPNEPNAKRPNDTERGSVVNAGRRAGRCMLPLIHLTSRSSELGHEGKVRLRMRSGSGLVTEAPVALRVPGPGFEPGWGCPQGILSRSDDLTPVSRMFVSVHTAPT